MWLCAFGIPDGSQHTLWAIWDPKCAQPHC